MSRKTGKELVEIFSTVKDPQILYKELDSFVNCFIVDDFGFIEAMKQQKPEIKEKWTNICLLWCLKLSELYCDGYYDDRNKCSCEIANKVMNNFTGEFPDMKETDLECAFVERFSRNHRTLIQTFSGLIFNWLVMLAVENKQPYKALVEQIPELKNRLPLI